VALSVASNVLPAANVNVPVPGVMVFPLIVLFVNPSLPDSVARVPVTGNVTLVAPVVVRVRSFSPEVVNDPPVTILPPSVIVIPVLATPVPPLAPGTIPVTFDAVPLTLPVTSPVTSPVKSALIVPALKSPFSSLSTIVFGLFDEVAVVAELVTFPDVLIVASLVSTIPASEAISAFTMVPFSILSEVTASAESIPLTTLPLPMVVIPVLPIVTSPLTATLFHDVPFDISIFLSFSVVEPNAAPLIFDTVGFG